MYQVGADACLCATMNMPGDDWVPKGLGQWCHKAGCWEPFSEDGAGLAITSGLMHLIGCVEQGTSTGARPEHACHIFEVALAAVRSSVEDCTI